MKHKTTSALLKILFCFFIVAWPVSNAFGQTIDPVSLPGILPVGICASAGSKHDVNFTIDETSGAFPVGTAFKVEFSYVSPNTIPQFTSINNTPPVITGVNKRRISFELPSNFFGSENYKIRIVASNGVMSNWFPGAFYYAYFRPYINPNFSILSGRIQANICLNGNITLSVDGGSTSTSPLSFNLSYIWEKSATSSGPFNVIIGEKLSSLSVNSAGFYRAKIDYGTCTQVIANPPTSQIVEVTQSGTGNTYTIVSSNPNPICSNVGTNLSISSGNGDTFRWFKDDVEIPNTNSNIYQAFLPGKYYVIVKTTSCGESTSGEYIVQVTPISASINVPVAPQINFVLSGDSLPVIASSTATSPTYQWYFQGNPIAGQTNNTFTATAPGNYAVIVTENTTCQTSEEIKFILKNGVPAVNIPNAISPNNDGINDTWIIPQKYLSGSKTEIQILTAQGKVEYTTTDYKNDWPTNTVDFKNTNPIYYYIITTANQETKMGSITIIK